MSNEVNEMLMENILADVCEMASDDIWNVINDIASNYGIDKLPYCKDNDTFIDRLVELRFEALCR
tara:strand:- start:10974 stop:11168 length:195 start_codon:yes stop_codon:yes gene_type:complete